MQQTSSSTQRQKRVQRSRCSRWTRQSTPTARTRMKGWSQMLQQMLLPVLPSPPACHPLPYPHPLLLPLDPLPPLPLALRSPRVSVHRIRASLPRLMHWRAPQPRRRLQVNRLRKARMLPTTRRTHGKVIAASEREMAAARRLRQARIHPPPLRVRLHHHRRRSSARSSSSHAASTIRRALVLLRHALTCRIQCSNTLRRQTYINMYDTSRHTSTCIIHSDMECIIRHSQHNTAATH